MPSRPETLWLGYFRLIYFVQCIVVYLGTSSVLMHILVSLEASQASSSSITFSNTNPPGAQNANEGGGSRGTRQWECFPSRVVNKDWNQNPQRAKTWQLYFSLRWKWISGFMPCWQLPRKRQPREEKVGVVPFAYSLPPQGKSSSISFTDLELVVPYPPAGVPLH